MSRKLNPKQLEAIRSANSRVLVLAGPGAGKTLTLVEKILLSLNEKKIKAANILAITFTKNAAGEMTDRLIASFSNTEDFPDSQKSMSEKERETIRQEKIKKIPVMARLNVKTFHALCHHILRNAGGKSFDNKFRLLKSDFADEAIPGNKLSHADEKPDGILHKSLMGLVKNTAFLLKLKRYILDYYVDKIHEERQQPNYPIKITYTTLQGEKVRSKSERDIADWLYRHEIKYKYEPQVHPADFPFKPDFFIPQANLYIEHISDKSYKTTDKKKQLRKAGRDYAEIHESDMQDTTKFNKKMESLLKGKISGKLSLISSLRYSEEMKGMEDKANEFLKMVMKILPMIKTASISFPDVLAVASTNQHERARIFYELAVPVMEAYNKYCIEKSYVDFDDLIIHTIKLLEENPDIRETYHSVYRQILVDEYQDINALQKRLLELLTSPSTQLFCVGDDRQSIYGFRGSDVRYIQQFRDNFPDADVIHLEINYRCPKVVVEASNALISHNSNFTSREVTSHSRKSGKIQLYRAAITSEDGVQFAVREIDNLFQSGFNQDDILVLYRRTSMYKHYAQAFDDQGWKIPAKTIHAAKGIESRFVFIIGMHGGPGGFPEIWADDLILKIIRDIDVKTLMEEERRLFYVAMTRAREGLYLISELSNESQFIDEIPPEFLNPLSISSSLAQMNNPNCSKCSEPLESQYAYCPYCGNQL